MGSSSPPTHPCKPDVAGSDSPSSLWVHRPHPPTLILQQMIHPLCGSILYTHPPTWARSYCNRWSIPSMGSWPLHPPTHPPEPDAAVADGPSSPQAHPRHVSVPPRQSLPLGQPAGPGDNGHTVTHWSLGHAGCNLKLVIQWNLSITTT